MPDGAALGHLCGVRVEAYGWAMVSEVVDGCERWAQLVQGTCPHGLRVVAPGWQDLDGEALHDLACRSEVLHEDNPVDHREREIDAQGRVRNAAAARERGRRRVAASDVVAQLLQHGHLVRGDGASVVRQHAKLK